MASINRINKALLAENIDKQVIDKIIGDDGDLINVIKRMDEMLAPDVKYKILDLCACCTKSSKSHKIAKDYGRVMAEKSLQEKINGLAGAVFYADCVTLNNDNTLTVHFCWDVNGNKTCSCCDIKAPIIAGKLLAKNKKVAVDDRVMPLSYCFCCAGHFRYHLQNALGIKLKTKEIVSSPINSKGEKPCEFILEIVG